MNRLSRQQQFSIIHLLLESTSLRAVSRLTGVHRTTCTELMLEFGTRCSKFLDREMRDLKVSRLALDEQWTFTQKKQKNVSSAESDSDLVGDQYIFLSFDLDTRLVPNFLIGKRSEDNTYRFVKDLGRRLDLPKPHASDPHDYQKGKYQQVVKIFTDGFTPYINAIDSVFSVYAAHGMIVKVPTKNGVSSHKQIVSGNITADEITTSLIERCNLTTRVLVKRLTRRTLAFSKKKENLVASIAMHLARYNYCWRVGCSRVTPAMRAGICGSLWSVQDLFENLM